MKRPRSESGTCARTDFGKFLKANLVRAGIACIEVMNFDTNFTPVPLLGEHKAYLDSEGYIISGRYSFATCEQFVWYVQNRLLVDKNEVQLNWPPQERVYYGEHSYNEWCDRIKWKVNMDSLQERLSNTELTAPVLPVVTFDDFVKQLFFPIIDSRFQPHLTGKISKLE